MFPQPTRFAQILTLWVFVFCMHAHSAIAQSEPLNRRTATIRATSIRSWPASPLMTAEQEKKIFDALTAPNTILKPGEVTLKQIAELMNEVVPTWIDPSALADTTYTVDEVFTITAHDADTPLASVLVRLFGDGDITFNVRNAMVEITSFEASEKQVGQSSRVYDITPLIDRYEEVGIDPNDYNPRSGGYQVVDCIQTSVFPDSWADTVGGPCTISSYRNGDQVFLVIAAPTIVQLSIQSLLDTLNQTNLYGGARPIRGFSYAAQRALVGRQATE